jgi:hypothetical protein
LNIQFLRKWIRFIWLRIGSNNRLFVKTAMHIHVPIRGEELLYEVKDY